VTDDELLLGSQRLSLGPARTLLAPYRGRTVIAGIRPEHLELVGGAGAGQAGMATLVADVRVVEELGDEAHVFFAIDATAAGASMLVAAAGEAEAGMLAGATHNGIARINSRSAVRRGQRVTFHVDTGRMHFFDPDTSVAVQQMP
jgi:multiple sugar transport system ATP-binding protein